MKAYNSLVIVRHKYASIKIVAKRSSYVQMKKKSQLQPMKEIFSINSVVNLCLSRNMDTLFDMHNIS